MRRVRPPPRHREPESPWVSFGDALTGLLFVFIALTFWASWQLSQQKAIYEQQTQQLRDAEQKARDLIGTQEALGAFSKCIADDTRQIQSVAPDPQNTSIALYLVEEIAWFEECSDDLTNPASAAPIRSAAIQRVRQCVADQLLIKDFDRYDIVLTFEGHTDGGSASGCPGGKKSNWTLSGARSAAVLEAFRDTRPMNEKIQLALSQDRHLQLIAAGLADSRPAWSAICDRETTGTADGEVCTQLKDHARLLVGEPGAEELRKSEAAIRSRLIQFLTRPMRGYKCSNEQEFHLEELQKISVDDLLSRWANSCPEGYAPATIENRLQKLRRVDVRLEFHPNLTRSEG